MIIMIHKNSKLLRFLFCNAQGSGVVGVLLGATRILRIRANLQITTWIIHLRGNQGHFASYNEINHSSRDGIN